MDKKHQVLQVMLDEALHKNAKIKVQQQEIQKERQPVLKDFKKTNLELQECYNKMKDKRCSVGSMKC